MDSRHEPALPLNKAEQFPPKIYRESRCDHKQKTSCMYVCMYSNRHAHLPHAPRVDASPPTTPALPVAPPLPKERGPRHPYPLAGVGVTPPHTPRGGEGGAGAIRPRSTTAGAAEPRSRPSAAARHGVAASRHALAPRTPQPGCAAAAAAVPHVSGGVLRVLAAGA